MDNVRSVEEERLNKTLQEIRLQIQEKEVDKGTYIRNMRSTYKNMWEDVDGAPNDLKELDQLVQAKLYLDEMRNMESAFQSTALKISKLYKMQDNPYFARIDFIEKGDLHTEEIYIGLSTVQNEDSMEILVYDWRAPISGMFYDYETGKASYTSPSGVIEGELLLKRQFRIQKGKLIYLFDSAIKIDDEILQELLGKSKDEKMKTIITSIQREQNKAIRDEGHKLLIVEGPAGSGKTSVALHRIAYLLYRYKDSVTSSNVVIFSPNEMFNDYISEVLPELGEENVRQTTFMEYAKKFLRLNVRIHDLNEQMEFILSMHQNAADRTRMDGMQVKSTMHFLIQIKEYIVSLYENPPTFDAFVHEGEEMIAIQEQMDLFRREYHYLPYLPRLFKVRNRVLYLIRLKELDKIQELITKMDNSPQWRDFTPKQKRNRAARIVLKQFLPLRKKARHIGNITILELYKSFYRWDRLIIGCNREEQQFALLAEQTIQQLERGTLFLEDLAPMIYLKGQLMGFSNRDYIRHVILDEAQDYTPVQLQIIHDLFPASSFTMVGDLNQSINPYANIGSMETVKQIFQTGDTVHIQMEKSYRSTREITLFCNAILGKNKSIAFINREGDIPSIKVFCNEDHLVRTLSENIKEILLDGYQSVAIIARTKREAHQVYKKLKPLISCHLVVESESEFPRGVTVIPSYLAKGLEFDAVYVLNLQKPYQGSSEQNLFYTVCTRALHRLFLYSLEQLPEYIESIPSSLYFLQQF